MKKILAGLCIISLCTLAGCVNEVVNPTTPVVETVPVATSPINTPDNSILLEFSYVRVFPYPEDAQDIWLSSNWTVFRNREVSYIEEYTDGYRNEDTWVLTEAQLESLVTLLSVEVQEDNDVPADIPLYSIKSYDEDNNLTIDFWGIPHSEYSTSLKEFIAKP